MIEISNKYGRVCFEIEDDFAHIFNLFVAPEYRRQKHGTKLIEHAIKSIREYGYSGKISIVADSKDNSSMTTKMLSQWYNKLGLEVYDYYE